MVNYLLSVKYKGARLLDNKLRLGISEYISKNLGSLNENDLPTSVTNFHLNSDNDLTVYSFSSDFDYERCSEKLEALNDFSDGLEYLLIDLDQTIKELKQK